MVCTGELEWVKKEYFSWFDVLLAHFPSMLAFPLPSPHLFSPDPFLLLFISTYCSVSSFPHPFLFFSSHYHFFFLSFSSLFSSFVRTLPNVRHLAEDTKGVDKLIVLNSVISRHTLKKYRTLIFCNTVKSCRYETERESREEKSAHWDWQTERQMIAASKNILIFSVVRFSDCTIIIRRFTWQKCNVPFLLFCLLSCTPL